MRHRLRPCDGRKGVHVLSSACAVAACPGPHPEVAPTLLPLLHHSSLTLSPDHPTTCSPDRLLTQSPAHTLPIIGDRVITWAARTKHCQ